MENDTSKKAKEISGEISKYLEEKYGEKFVVAQLVSDRGIPGVIDKAYAYPEGQETDSFTVRVYTDDETGDYSFLDGYGFIFAEQKILPAYQVLIEKAMFEAKITVKINNEFGITKTGIDKDVPFEEFAEREAPFEIHINIFLKDEVLAEKEVNFEKLSNALNDTPGRSFNYNYKIMFVQSDEFAAFNEKRCKEFSLSEYRLNVKEVVACTHILLTEEIEKATIGETLLKNFIDTANFNMDDLLNKLGGENNE